jgi:hypothetical protein
MATKVIIAHAAESTHEGSTMSARGIKPSSSSDFANRAKAKEAGVIPLVK